MCGCVGLRGCELLVCGVRLLLLWSDLHLPHHKHHVTTQTIKATGTARSIAWGPCAVAAFVCAFWPITASAAAVSGSSSSAGGLLTLLPWHFQPAAALFFVGAVVVWSGAFCSKVGGPHCCAVL